MSSEAAERVRKHKERALAAGLRKISVWVPEQDAERMHDIAAHFREQAGAVLPTDGQPARRAVEVPVVPGRRPKAARVFLMVGQEELGIHMLLRANDGVWLGQQKLWDVPEDLPAKLGLLSRIVDVAKEEARKPEPVQPLPSVQERRDKITAADIAAFAMRHGITPAKPRRNDPCPCGSGKKFKRCCASP